MNIKKKMLYNYEYERAILKIFIINKNKFQFIYGQLKENDFYHKDHAMIFKTIITLYKNDKFFDISNILEYINGQNYQSLEGVIDTNYFNKLLKDCSSYNNIIKYVKEVKKKIYY